MDAEKLLQQVVERYAALKSLAVEIISITEDGDDESSNRNQRRAKALFAAPNRVRIEQGGRHGSLTVTNGVDVYHYSAFQKSYTKRPVKGTEMMPGSFRPEHPFVQNTTFLFDRLASRVVAAEILREELIKDDFTETACHVLSVKYEPNPQAALFVSRSPMTFYVDSRTYLIRKIIGDFTMRVPAEDETRTLRYTVSLKSAVVDETIPSETFEFSPPADAEIMASGRMRGSFVTRSRHGGASSGDDQKRWIERSESSSWEGDTYVQRTKLRLRGIEITFERRLSISEGSKEVRVAERISGPKGQVEHEFSVPTA